MPFSGPVPKRDEERIRRNKPEFETTVVEMIGAVPPPALGIEDVHPLVQDIYDSLLESGQTKYYEPSDWQFARFTMHFANELLQSAKPSSMMLQQVNAMMADLLITEGQRRRVRMEIERGEPEGKVIDIRDMFKARLMAVPAVA